MLQRECFCEIETEKQRDTKKEIQREKKSQKIEATIHTNR